MNKEQQINLRVNKEEKDLLKEDAKKEERSVSSLLIWCWKRWRKKKE